MIFIAKTYVCQIDLLTENLDFLNVFPLLKVLFNINSLHLHILILVKVLLCMPLFSILDIESTCI